MCNLKFAEKNEWKGFKWASEEAIKKSDTIQSMLSRIKPTYLQGLVTNWWQRQDGSKANPVRNKSPWYCVWENHHVQN